MLSWAFKNFTELSPEELYRILEAREEIFQIEQNCIYKDIDGIDRKSHHLTGSDPSSGRLAVYLRIVAPGICYSEPSIGRVVTVRNFRGRGWGKELMKEGHRRCEELYPGQAIRIGAQQYLKKFYEEQGYEQVSEMYLLDGIPHIEMLRRG